MGTGQERSRILLFVHYNRRDKFSDHALYTLTALRPHFNTVYVVSNSPLPSEEMEALRRVADNVRSRENRGFDFSAWKSEIHRIG